MDKAGDVGAAAAATGRRPPQPCDYCGDAEAALHCCADAARLCVACDRHVHAANALSRKHVRSPLCAGCGSRPAAAFFFGAGDTLSLCSDCDWACGGGGGPAATKVPPSRASPGAPPPSRLRRRGGSISPRSNPPPRTKEKRRADRGEEVNEKSEEGNKRGERE